MGVKVGEGFRLTPSLSCSRAATRQYQLMHRVIESTLVSLDGVIRNPQTWAEPYFGKEANSGVLIGDRPELDYWDGEI